MIVRKGVGHSTGDRIMERRLCAILAADMAGYSRLMERNETDVLNRQKLYRRELIDPAIAQAGGQIVKTTGDGMLARFDTAQAALRCALEIQQAMQQREEDTPRKERIQYRIGINIGDIVLEDGDIFGDAANVAARLEAISEPGAICVSDIVHQITQDRVSEPFTDLGLQKVKNITRPIRVWQWVPDADRDQSHDPQPSHVQHVSFCIAGDGTQLAWARVGKGPSVLKAPNWLNHLDYEWRSPLWGPFLEQMSQRCDLVRFDQRGNGLSDRDPHEISEDAMISDMRSIVQAAGLDRFLLFGISQGCAFSVRYAAENPDKVAGLILVSGYLRGSLKRGSPEQAAISEATNVLIREGWGSPNPAYRHLFTESMMPDATEAQKAVFDELQRVSCSPEVAARINTMNATVDVSGFAPRIRVPTLVLHSEGDRRVPVAEGRRMAAMIPGARFVTLPGNNHALIDNSPALDLFLSEFSSFLAEIVES